jgi:four helix bundle protein
LRSRKEFTAKLGTAAEEADECVDWLEYLRDGRIGQDPTLLPEATELAKIMVTAYRTAKGNDDNT